MRIVEFLASLRKLRIVLRVRESKLEVEAPVGALTEDLRAKIIQKKPELLAFLQTSDQTRAVDEPIQPRPREGDVPLSFAQERLWFIEQLQPGGVGSNMPAALRIQGALRIEILERTINEIIRRHEVLRTTFRPAANGATIQVIHRHEGYVLPVLDLHGLNEEERTRCVKQLMEEERLRPFDLSRGPLVRVQLLRLGEQDYVLFYTLHHIVSDGWSMEVVNWELGTLYEAFAEGRASPLPELPVQYADFAVWQRGWLQAEALEKQLSYWKGQLAGVSPLELATDHPRPAIQSFNGASQEIKIDSATVEALKRLGAEQGVTLFMTLLAGFQALLSRYSGQEDIVVGSPIANRTREEVEGLIGFFVNTLVMRTDLSGDPTVGELLQRVRQVSLGAFEHQDLPFELLVKELQPERDLSRNPVFQVVFALNNTPNQDAEFTHLTFRPAGGAGVTTKFDLDLHFSERSGELTGGLIYNTDLFDSRTMRRMSEHFVRLVGLFAERPQNRLSDLEILSAPEREQLLVGWNDTAVEYPKDKCFPQLFEEQVERTPDAVAVVYDGERLTYGELNGRANQLAHYLQSLGVGPEVLVAVQLERSFDFAVTVLGILKAGGAYLPLDNALPAERLDYILEDSQAAVLVCQENQLARLPATAAKRVAIDNPVWKRPFEPARFAANPNNQATADGLAYVMYTSGSTGKPKGVQITHRSMLNHNFAFANAFKLCAADRVLQFSSLSFDISIEELFPTWLTGALVVMRPDEILDPGKFWEFVASEAISILNLPTAFWHQLVPLLKEGSVPSSLRLVVVGGEKASQQTYEAWKRVVPESVPFINTYGPTETTVTATLCGDGPRQDHDVLSIGRPIDNVRVYILDQRLQPVPIGCPGELHIGGLGVARGYLNRPELTAKKFIPNPFSSVPGARLYQTGDLARYLPDGNIEFVGRKDNQVKIRGYRIELGEIENVIREYEGVVEAVVVVREDEPGQKRLVGYVVWWEGTEGDSQLRSYLQGKLPEYMVPGQIMMLEALPLTPNGKVDRKALPEPRMDLKAEGYEGPRTPVEELLVGIWQEVLKVERVGIHDNFFELGGHSLLATQLVSRVRELFKVGLLLRDLFERPTVGGLVQKLEEEQRSGKVLTVPPLTRVEREREIPLSYAQERLWFINQLDPNSAAYTMPGALRIDGVLDVGAMERAINEIIRRHESLRTVFQMSKEGLVQVIGNYEWQALPMVDLGGLPDGVREQVGRELRREESRRPFDLSRGPLVRVRLLRLGPAEQVILYTMHHIISDGWSMEVVNRELGALYEAFAEGKSSPLPELPIQYADFAVWQRGWLQGDVLEKQVSYWKEQLAGVNPLELATDHRRPATPSFNGAAQEIKIDSETVEALKRLGAEQGVTLFMTLLAGFQILLSRYSGQKDIVVGTPIANRTRKEVEGLIGFFANTLVMRTDLSGDPTLSELLQRVRKASLGAFENQDLPFEILVKELQPERDVSRNPLFQVLFASQDMPKQDAQFTSLTLRPAGGAEVMTTVDLALHFWERSGEIAGGLVYNTDLFESRTIQRMSENFVRLVGLFGENHRLKPKE